MNRKFYFLKFMSVTTVRFPDPVRSEDNSSDVLVESSITLIIIIVFAVIALVAAVFFLKKRKLLSAKIGWPAIGIGLGVIFAVILIFLICWWRSKRARSCATLYSDQRDVSLGPSVLTIDGYSITSDFIENNYFGVSSSYANDLMGIQLFSHNSSGGVVSKDLVSSGLTMGKYYGKTVIISNNDVDLTTLNRVMATFTHGSVSYQSQASIVTTPSTHSVVVKIPVFGYTVFSS